MAIHCNTLVLTPLTLKIHDTYIGNNLGAELKAKAPPLIWLCYVHIGIVTNGISEHTARIKLWHHVNVHLN